MRIRLNRLGAVLLSVLAACVVLGFAGTGGVQVAGLVGAVVIVLLLVGTPRGAANAAVWRWVRGLGPDEPASSSDLPDSSEEAGDGAWARERARREGRR